MQKIYQEKPLITKTKIHGCYFLTFDKNIDHRGYFFNIMVKNYFFNKFSTSTIKQVNLAQNTNKGTLRGLHYQSKPFSESKIVVCLKGAIFDVVLDLRKYSKTFKQFITVELNSKKNQLIHIPKNCAHGYQTLDDDTHLLYLHTENYIKSHESGIDPFDEELGINWPIDKKILSKKDRNLKKLCEYEL